jgi:hypothetical protein
MENDLQQKMLDDLQQQMLDDLQKMEDYLHSMIGVQ